VRHNIIATETYPARSGQRTVTANEFRRAADEAGWQDRTVDLLLQHDGAFGERLELPPLICNGEWLTVEDR
jgi:hypothetical protein